MYLESCGLVFVGTLCVRETKAHIIIIITINRRQQQWTLTRACPKEKNKTNQLTGKRKIFTSTVYNLIYKYILGIN